MPSEDKTHDQTVFSLRSVFISTAFAASAFTLHGIANRLKQGPYSEDLVMVCSAVDLLAILGVVACCMTPVISALHSNDRRKGTSNALTCVIILIWLAAIPFILFVGPLLDWLLR